MRHYVIVGAGALGSIMAALLVRDGKRVTLVCRPGSDRAQQLQRDGLLIEGLQNVQCQCEVVSDPASIASADVLVFTPKAYQLQGAAESLRHIVCGTVFSVANGISKNAVLAECFGEENIVGCVADYSGELEASGRVLYTRNNGITLGELDGSESQRLEELLAALSSAGLVTLKTPEILSEEWSKFAAWVPVALLAIVTREYTWKFLSDRCCAKLAREVVTEIGKLADSAGVELVDRSLLPSASLVTLDERDGVEKIIATGGVMKEQAVAHKMSVVQDLEKGKTLEIDDTVGYALQLAEQYDMTMPATNSLYQVARAINSLQV